MKALRLPIRVSTATYLVRGRSPHDPSIVRARLCAPGSSEASSGPGLCCAGRPSFRPCSRGREWDLSGLQAIHPVPLLRSRTPAEPMHPRLRGRIDAAPAIRTAKASTMADFGANPKLRHLLSYASRARCRSRAKLASGWLAQPLPGGSRTRWIATRGFSSCSRSSSPPALLTLPDCASLHPGYQLGLPATTKWRRSAARQLQAACPNSDIENLESKHRRVSLKHRVITRK